jgi:hypothetical protein
MIAVGACPLSIPTVHAYSFQGLSCRSKTGGEAGLRSDAKSVSIVHVSQYITSKVHRLWLQRRRRTGVG